MVSAGTFLVPPATASLMYAPQINGASAAQTITTEKEAKIIPQKLIQKLSKEQPEKLKKSLSQKIIPKIVIITTVFFLILVVIGKKWFVKIIQKIKTLFNKKTPPSSKENIPLPPPEPLS